jgi:hypothetical protein
MTLNVLSPAGSIGNTGVINPLRFSSHLASASHRSAGTAEFRDIAEPMNQERRI